MINFDKEELYWIERTADFEYSIAISRFLKIVSENSRAETVGERGLVKQYVDELIKALIILKEIRDKCEIERKSTKEVTK